MSPEKSAKLHPVFITGHWCTGLKALSLSPLGVNLNWSHWAEGWARLCTPVSPLGTPAPTSGMASLNW
jgi:hypothetical protein